MAIDLSLLRRRLLDLRMEFLGVGLEELGRMLR